MSHRDFSDHVVVVTGASGGVGAAAAEELARRGASVVLAARRAGPLGEVAKRCGSQAHSVVADVTKRDDVQRIFDEAVAKFGRVDIWINNVGRGIGRPLLEITDDDVDAMIRGDVCTQRSPRDAGGRARVCWWHDGRDSLHRTLLRQDWRAVHPTFSLSLHRAKLGWG
ncbi:SDR family oxidoreductase [Sorangium sp. So ce260]|uniref:SDR family oxidoreductase n=1 Tax=Sorangium sp. So ce260 TaxID=3133291 RepID=UPI003F5F6AE1